MRDGRLPVPTGGDARRSTSLIVIPTRGTTKHEEIRFGSLSDLRPCKTCLQGRKPRIRHPQGSGSILSEMRVRGSLTTTCCYESLFMTGLLGLGLHTFKTLFELREQLRFASLHSIAAHRTP